MKIDIYINGTEQGLKIDPYFYGQPIFFFFLQSCQSNLIGKRVFLLNGAATTRYPHGKKITSTLILCHTLRLKVA